MTLQRAQVVWARYPRGRSVFTQRWPANAKEREQGRRDKVIFYQYRTDRARRSLRGIDEQVAKAEKSQGVLTG